MTPRSIRRAAERKARKEAFKAARAANRPGATDHSLEAANNFIGADEHEAAILSEPEPETAVASSAMPSAASPARAVSSARLAAHRANARLSTGPHNEQPSRGFNEQPGRHREGAVRQALSPARTSPAQLTANRHNAQLSTGPRTAAGKSTVALNALKTGLTGRTVLLPTEDAAAYEAHVSRFFHQYSPAGEPERELVQSLADARWRLNRIPSLEYSIYALARVEFADLFPDHAPEARAALIQAHTFLVYQRQLNNLSIQETRLRRQFDKDLAELRALQADRSKKQPAAQPQSAKTTIAPAIHPEIGFEFSAPAPDSPNNPILNELTAESCQLTALS